MRRRTFLGAIGATGIGAFAGCSALENESNTPSEQDDRLEQPDPPQNQITQPRPEVVEHLSPTVELDTSTNPIPDRYSATIENTGHRGNIAVALFWQLSETDVTPQSADTDPVSGPWRREEMKEIFVEAEDERLVEFVASEPEEAIDHSFYAEPATYGGRVQNLGGFGDITITLYEEPIEENPIKRGNKTIYFQSGQSEDVFFNTILDFGGRWYLETSTI